MMTVFIDTNALFSLVNKKEEYYFAVFKKYQEYKRQRANLLSSDYILNEFFTLSLSRTGSFGARFAVKATTEIIDNGQLTIIQVDPVIFKKAKDIFLKFLDQKISFTDATTYVICKEYKIDELFTLDSDFKKLRLKTAP